MTSESKILLGLLAATVTIIGVAIIVFSRMSPVPIVSRNELITPTTYTKGNASASSYLVEFSDFQCPGCKAAKPVVDALVEQFKDKLVFGYRHFPLPQHSFAMPAARAAEAAGKQGKYWEMYDLLFANQDKFSETIFTDLAKQLQLDERAFEQAFIDQALISQIQADRDTGIKLGINSTPTFFLNGKRLDLSSFEDIKTAIETAVQQ